MKESSMTPVCKDHDVHALETRLFGLGHSYQGKIIPRPPLKSLPALQTDLGSHSPPYKVCRELGRGGEREWWSTVR